MHTISNGICVTGHRPKDLYGYQMCKEYNNIVVDMYKHVHLLYLQGYRKFITGMAQGIDTLFAEAVLEFRKYFPDCMLICYVPYSTQCEYLRPNGIFGLYRYLEILNTANEVKILFENPQSHYDAANKLQKRNEAMVNASDIILAYHLPHKNKGGTYNCIRYAKKQRKEIIYRDPTNLSITTNPLICLRDIRSKP